MNMTKDELISFARTRQLATYRSQMRQTRAQLRRQIQKPEWAPLGRRSRRRPGPERHRTWAPRRQRSVRPAWTLLQGHRQTLSNISKKEIQGTD